ncbi:MAG: dihydrofolate reductase family protein [Bacillota bacterium]
MTLLQKEFRIETIKLNRIYDNFPADYHKSDLKLEKVEEIYETFQLPVLPSNRPLLLGCFVSSIEGTIAFKDNQKSGVIARNKPQHSNGGIADLWILNLLRTVADGIIIGPKTLQVEENLTGHILDNDLLKARRDLLNKPEVPYNIIISKTGQSIPYQHRIFEEEEVPVLIATSPQGAEKIIDNINSSYEVIDLASKNNYEKNFNFEIVNNKVVILITGENNNLEEKSLFEFLKVAGLDKIIVEAPSYAHYLIKNELLDEIFLNQSGVYSGGPTFLNNNSTDAFKSSTAPSAKMITVHTYDAYFFYFRYKLVY